MYAALMVRLGPIVTVTVAAHHSLIIYQSHQILSYSQMILIKMAISVNLVSFFLKQDFLSYNTYKIFILP